MTPTILDHAVMNVRASMIRWSLFALATLWACPALADHIDCKVHDPVAQAICTHPKLMALDRQLSVAYVAALARDPAQANDLKHDEIRWLGDRNREMWWSAAASRKFPSLPGDLDNDLAPFYRLRIAFLDNVDNPGAIRGRPIATRLLAAAKALPAAAPDALEALAATGVVVVPRPHADASVIREISTLAAAPDLKLRKALQDFDGAPFTVVYLPQAGLGGAFTIEGTADCQHWVVFRKQGDATVPVGGHVPELGGACTRDGGSTGYLALVDGYPVAINVTVPPSFPNVTDLQWRRWLGGDTWSAPSRIRLRYGYTLKLYDKNYCPSAAPECAQTPTLALRAARRYLNNPWKLERQATAVAGFRQMQARAPGLDNWAGCAYPVWFATRLDGKPVVAGISESLVGCHPGGGFLAVGFWGLRNDGQRWWSADDTVLSGRTRLLAAAVIPPNPNP